MKQSLTYYFTLLVIKLKGIKKNFSKDPIDYAKIRREDVYTPKGQFFRKNVLRQFGVLKTSVTEVGYNNDSEKLLLFIHGGAFISGPAKHHWDTLKKIAVSSDYTIWMCNYPKAPECEINEISENIAAIFSKATQEFETKNIVLLGDSVGGTLITGLVQRLILKQHLLPKKLILISPVMDASFSNSLIETIEPLDPMLSKSGLLSAKKMCANNSDLKDPLISPLYGSFSGFPKIILYAGERDITYPDQILAYKKAIKAKVDIQLIFGKNMPHIWPLLPIMKEAQVDLDLLIENLNQS